MSIDLSIFLSKHSDHHITQPEKSEHGEWDPDSPNRMNHDFIHGPSEFVTGAHDLAIGCSVTAGAGLPRKLTWPHIYSAITARKVNVCSFAGHGPDSLMSSASELIGKLGCPDRVMILLPNPQRSIIPSFGYLNSRLSLIRRAVLGFNPDQHKWIYYKAIHFVEAGRHAAADLEEFKPTNIFGRKYSLDNADIPKESVQQLLDFYRLLSINPRIKFMMTTWNYRAWRDNTYQELPMIDLRWGNPIINLGHGVSAGLGDPRSTKCGHKPRTPLQEKYWTVAADNVHPGVHHHIHIAELMAEYGDQ